ncbi:MAG: hypothetical protein CMJ49_03370, partial [Planctomycetaceae bacterium]|nr:hypothetical protein [Planctomycetaceae bacterium]
MDAPDLSHRGTYALVMRVGARRGMRIGALGWIDIEVGHYVYVGSALGPGGVGARIAHHLGACVRPHWHIDYLL